MGFFKRNRRNVWVGGILLCLCVLTYSNSLSNQFTIDDYELLIHNPQMHNIKFLPQIFSIDPEKKTYRPFPHLISMLTYLCFGPNPVGHHLIQLILFYICAVTFYALLNMLFENWKIAFLTSLFFVAHPINGLLVNYTAMAPALLVLPLNLSMITFLLAEGKRSRAYFLISLMCFLVGLMSHEVTLFYPLYLASALFLVKRYSLRETVLKCLPYAALAALYFLFIMKIFNLKGNLFAKMFLYKISFFIYVATFSKLIFWYISKLIFLNDIVLLWSTPFVKTDLVGWILGLGIFLFTCFYFILKREKKIFRSLGLTWFLIGFIPLTVACFFRGDTNLMIEHGWFFFSTIGFFVFVAYLLTTLIKNKIIFTVFTGVILVGYVFSSRQHNERWADKKTYCEYWVKIVPENFIAVNMLADAYYMDGELEKAKELYDQLLSKRWDNSKTYINLGLIERARGNTKKAIENFKIALALQPNSVNALTNLGATLADLKDFKGAKEAYLKAIELNRFSIEPRFNLAMIYRTQKEFVKAADLLEQVLAIDPNDGLAIFFLGESNLVSGSKDRAIELTKNLLTKSKDPQRLVNLGSHFAQERFSNMAFALYSRALTIDPCYKEAYIEMGKVFGNRDQFKQAIVVWQEGLKCHPREKVFEDLISEARELLKGKMRGSE